MNSPYIDERDEWKARILRALAELREAPPRQRDEDSHDREPPSRAD